MHEWIKQSWHDLNTDLQATARRKFLSPIIFSQYRITLPLIQKYAHGELIDLGSGHMPFRPYVQNQVETYESMDIISHSEDITYIGNIEDMSFIGDQKYDTALCLEVLEHVPNVTTALEEIHRILKPDGTLILSVPHLSRLHDEPDDFYRFTRYGLEHILSRSGFRVARLEIRGGLLSFIGHQISTMILSLSWNIPIVNDIVFWLNSILITRLSYWVDQRLDRSGVFAAGYTVVAQKNMGQTGKSNFNH